MKFNRDDQGVASVIGIILVAGVLFAFLAVVRVDYVPVWEENVEMDHLDNAEHSLGILASDLVTYRASGDTTSVAQTIPMVATERVLFGPMRLPGNLAVESRADAFTVQADNMIVFEQNGVAVAAGANQYSSFDSAGTIPDVTRLNALRLRISDMGASDVDTTFQIAFADADGARLGSLSGTIGAASTSGTAVTIDIVVVNAAGETIGTRSDSVGVAAGDGLYFLDVLSQDLQTASLLAAGASPYTISLTSTTGILDPVGGLGVEPLGGAKFDYSASYEQQQPDGSISSVNPGTPVAPFARSADVANIEYSHSAQYAVQQNFALEFGALVLTQPDGAVVRAAPGIHIFASGGDLNIMLNVPSNSSPPTSTGGPRVGVFKATHASTESWAGTSEDVTFTFQTDSPQAWAQYFQSRIHDAGFNDGTDATPGAAVTTTDTQVSLTLQGSAVDANSGFDQIIVRVTTPNFRMVAE